MSSPSFLKSIVLESSLTDILHKNQDLLHVHPQDNFYG